MFDHLFTDKEAELILEMLESESKSLTTEARRTSTPALRKELHERLRTVRRLIQRFLDLRAGVYGGQDLPTGVAKTTGGVP